jgi:hypothetical protein
MTTFTFGALSFILYSLIAGVQGESNNANLRGLRRLEANGYNENLGQCEGATCSLWGDPHIITCDGLAYDCQGQGLFTLMKNHLYNIQGNFAEVGVNELKMVSTWNDFPEASYTNDVMIDYAPDEDDNDVPTMQFSFPDLSNHDGSFTSEEGCLVNKYYKPFLGPRSVETSLAACRERCENMDGCAKFSYWGDGGCHMNKDNSNLKSTPSSWSRSLAGSPAECGTPIEQTVEQQKTTEESDKARIFGNGRKDQNGPGCPILFYLDGEIQDISEVEDNAYLFGDANSDHSAQLVGYNQVRIVHKLLESDAVSEVLLEIAGDGPGELWSCHWNFFVCLPAAEQERFEAFSVGLLGTPDGNTQNDWTDVTGQSIVIPYEKRGQGAFDYCHDNWCVSQEDSIMAYPSGTTYEDHQCGDEEYVDFNVDNEMCVISADKINEKCNTKTPLLVHSCQIDCCLGGCDSFDIVEEEIVGMTTLSTYDEDIVYNDFVPTSICDEETYKVSTSETACPSSNKGVVELVYQSAEIPDVESSILYDFVIEPPAIDDNIGQTIKFKVDNPFADHADIYVRSLKKVGESAMDPTCDNMPNTVAGCNPEAREIQVGCHEFPGVDAFAIVDIYFVSNEDSFIIDNAVAGTEVDKCCKPLDAYNEDGYGVIKVTFQIQCTCPEGQFTERV